jgi:metal-responsive CopG/Arc/MetJ family transcriptional regulator
MAESDFLRKQIYITKELNQRLRQSAAWEGSTESAIIREALEEYLTQEQRRNTPKDQNPILQMIGMFEGDQSCRDVSSNIEEHLVDALGKEQ